MNKGTIPAEVYAEMRDLVRIGNRAVHRAQEESRRLGVPNVYSFNGILYYELPNGELLPSNREIREVYLFAILNFTV